VHLSACLRDQEKKEERKKITDLHHRKEGRETEGQHFPEVPTEGTKDGFTISVEKRGFFVFFTGPTRRGKGEGGASLQNQIGDSARLFRFSIWEEMGTDHICLR